MEVSTIFESSSANKHINIMRFLLFLNLLLLYSCGNSQNQKNSMTEKSVELYNIFDKEDHLRPAFNKTKFDTLHGWDFGWELLKPINIAKNDNHEKKLAKRFAPGQKALYFIWYLDAQLTNGGFIQFFWNYDRQYIPPIVAGLELIGDTSMLKLVDKADEEYLKHVKEFAQQRKKKDWEPLYNKLKSFDKFDETYYTIHDKTMELIEAYARKHPDEFVKFN